MDFLIKAYWYQGLAHKLGIKITNAQVQTALNNAKKGQFSTSAQFQQFLTQSGQTMQDILFRVRVQQIYQKLLAKHPTTVTPALISTYYSNHQSQFGTPESRNLKIVLTKTQAQAEAAKKALQKGGSWKAVVKKYSIDPTTKKTGGVLTGVTKGQQDQALTTAAFSAPANKIIGPVKGQFGYYVIEVTKITAATQKTLAQSTALIKQTLTSQLQTKAQNAIDSQAKKAWLSKTKCRSAYAMADCSGYKAPKTSTSGAAGAAGASGAAGAAGGATAPAPAGSAPAPAGSAPAPAGSAPAPTGTAPAP
jgi:foldase protein PrsA